MKQESDSHVRFHLASRVPIAAMDFYEAWDFAEASQGLNKSAGNCSQVPEPDDSNLTPLDFMVFKAASHCSQPDKDRSSSDVSTMVVCMCC